MIKRRLFSSLLLMASASAQADNALGQINIELRGNVVDYTCVAQGNDSDKTVTLGRWASRQLQNSGSTTPPVPFTLALTGCPPGAASITFSGPQDAGDPTLLALNSGSSARGVAVEIRDAGRRRLPLQQASQEVTVDAQGNATLQFYANYISTTETPQAGSADADATFMINYN